MRHLVRALLVVCLLTGPLTGIARGVSIDDLYNLKANGLSDDVLVALIETDGSVFNLTAADVIALYKRGLSEKVILAMIASGRKARVSQPASDPQPLPTPSTDSAQGNMQVSVSAPGVEAHSTPAPIQIVSQQVDTPVTTTTVVTAFPYVVPIVAPLHRPIREVTPVFWGFGGNLRPDAWVPAGGVIVNPGSGVGPHSVANPPSSVMSSKAR